MQLDSAGVTFPQVATLEMAKVNLLIMDLCILSDHAVFISVLCNCRPVNK